jgi:C-terminal processing protease CtpA/Prc
MMKLLQESSMSIRRQMVLVGILLATVSLGCQAITGIQGLPVTETAQTTPTPAATATPLPPIPVIAGEANPDEPVYIQGEIPYTSPFFLNTLSEPFVLLEDQAGFIQRDREFVFNLESQVIGPVIINPDDSLTYSLALPTIPQGTMVDVDQNGQNNPGVQVFGVAYWSNTWGGPFLEDRDGTGWSTAYASTITDPDNDDEIKGGILIVWAPDDQQGFPSGFGADDLLFTEDDPIQPVPAGYSIVDLDQEPFQIWKESRPFISLNEGEIALNDYSEDSYSEAFEKLFEKASREYPFTQDKAVDWQALYDEFAPQVAQASDPTDFYTVLREFTYRIPDGHVGLTIDPEVFYQESGGSFGMILTELSDGQVIVSDLIPNTAATEAGIEIGAKIIEWDGQPVGQAIDQVTPFFGPYSTDHHKRQEQVVFLTRVPPGTRVNISYQNPGESRATEVRLTADVEYDSLFKAIPSLNQDELVLPIEGQVLGGSGLGYIRINTFSDDYRIMAQLWEHYLQGLIDNQVPGLIIDVRTNGGGSSGMAYDFAGYFFDQLIPLYQSSYYNDRTGQFEYTDHPAEVEPGPIHFEGPVAVLVSPYCVSACEGFSNAMSMENRAIIVGHYPTAGAFGEVGRGQYKLPADISMQFPTGRPETMDGRLYLEGTGVLPDISVPVTEASALNRIDAVLQAAIQAVQDEIEK